LLYLPAVNVFGVQRVSTQWKQVIATSPLLHEKLFLRLKSSNDPSWTLASTADTDVYSYDAMSGEMIVTKLSNMVQLNPLLLRDGFQDAKFDTTLSPSDVGLWRKAFVTDPPCHTVYMDFDWHVDGSPASLGVPLTFGRAGVHIISESGLTLGDVVDAIVSQDCKYLFAMEYPVTRFLRHTPLQFTGLTSGNSSKIVRDISRPMQLRFENLCILRSELCDWRK